MKRIVIFFICCFSVLTYAQQTPVQVEVSGKKELVNGKEYYVHEVKKGQTPYSISKAYGVTLEDLYSENPSLYEGVRPGQVIRVIIKQPAPVQAGKINSISKDTDADKYLIHKVEQGQTLYSIAKQYKVTVESLRELNPEIAQGLKVGQEIKVLTGITYQPDKPAKPPGNPAMSQTITSQGIESSKYNEDKVKAILTGKKLISIDSVPVQSDNDVRVALFLPFLLNEGDLTESKTSEIDKKDDYVSDPKVKVAVEFYEGFLMGVDSLKKQGISGKIYTYDSGNKDSLWIENILKKPELKQVDIFIGPLFAYNFQSVANFAKENDIFIVSPLSTQNKILFNNVKVSKVRASSPTIINELAQFTADSFFKENIIAVNSGISQETVFVNTFKAALNTDSLKIKIPMKDYLYNSRSAEQLKNLLVTDKLNVVVMPSNNQVIVTDFITKLIAMDLSEYRVQVIGMQSWQEFSNLDVEALNKLSVHMPVYSFVDYNDVATKKFIESYRKKYHTDPSEYAFHGYDIAQYYLNAVHQYGKGMNSKIIAGRKKGLQSEFDFEQFAENSGYENSAVIIIKYQDYNIVRVK